MLPENDRVGGGGLLQLVPPPPPPPPPVSGPLPAQPTSASPNARRARSASDAAGERTGSNLRGGGSASWPADRRCGIDDLLAQARHLIPRHLPPTVDSGRVHSTRQG